MKNKTVKIIVILCLAMVISYIGFSFTPLTPWGATRLSILLTGYPVNAFTTGLQYHESSNGEKYYILTNPPYEKETETNLDQWNIKNYGIFYWSEYGVS